MCRQMESITAIGMKERHFGSLRELQQKSDRASQDNSAFYLRSILYLL